MLRQKNWPLYLNCFTHCTSSTEPASDFSKIGSCTFHIFSLLVFFLPFLRSLLRSMLYFSLFLFSPVEAIGEPELCFSQCLFRKQFK